MDEVTSARLGRAQALPRDSARPAWPPSASVSATTEGQNLIEGMAGGHRQSLEQFYDHFGQAVYNLVVRIVRGSADAEEVVQEVFFQAWREAGRYDPARGTPHAWLMTLARSRALDSVRAIRRAHQIGEFGIERDVEDPSPARAEQFADRALVRNALAALAPAQWRLLALAYYGGFTQTEIAARTGVPLGTVKTRIRAALEHLRQALGKGDAVLP